jgi:hypothetical protein
VSKFRRTLTRHAILAVQVRTPVLTAYRMSWFTGESDLNLFTSKRVCDINHMLGHTVRSRCEFEGEKIQVRQ